MTYSHKIQTLCKTLIGGKQKQREAAINALRDNLIDDDEPYHYTQLDWTELVETLIAVAKQEMGSSNEKSDKHLSMMFQIIRLTVEAAVKVSINSL